MPSLYNESTGMIETLSERYEREFLEMQLCGIIDSTEEQLDQLEDDLMFEGDLNDISS